MTIVEYVRNRKQQRIGVVVAVKSDLETLGFRIGWSQCKVKLDKFNKDFGLKIALGRAYLHPLSWYLCYISDNEIVSFHDNVPHSVRRTFQRVFNRSIRYFKKENKSENSHRFCFKQ